MTRAEMIEALEQVQSVGLQMSNLCYNVAQRSATDERDRITMRELVAAWDALSDARKQLRAALTAEGETPPACICPDDGNGMALYRSDCPNELHASRATAADTPPAPVADLARLTAERDRLREALVESHALNVNVFEDAEPEMLAYYSEYKAVIGQLAAALADTEGGHRG